MVECFVQGRRFYLKPNVAAQCTQFRNQASKHWEVVIEPGSDLLHALSIE